MVTDPDDFHRIRAAGLAHRLADRQHNQVAALDVRLREQQILGRAPAGQTELAIELCRAPGMSIDSAIAALDIAAGRVRGNAASSSAVPRSAATTPSIDHAGIYAKRASAARGVD